MTPTSRTSGSTSGSARTRARRGEGDLLRDEILDATEGLLVSHGSMDAVPLRSVATAVGVSPPSIYLHFADKDDLFFAVCERRFAHFDDVLRAASEGIDDPVERLRAMGLAYVRHGIEHAEHYQLLFGPKAADLVGDRDLSDSAGMNAFQRLTSTIAEGIERGAFREQDPWLAAFSVWSTVHGAVMIVLAKEGLAGSGFPLPDLETLASVCCETVIHGLAVPA